MDSYKTQNATFEMLSRKFTQILRLDFVAERSTSAARRMAKFHVEKVPRPHAVFYRILLLLLTPEIGRDLASFDTFSSPGCACSSVPLIVYFATILAPVSPRTPSLGRAHSMQPGLVFDEQQEQHSFVFV